MASDMLICVMCFTKLEKKSDINLVRGKRAVDIAAEIEDLNFVLHPVSRHICRHCLSLLTQRINHRKKLENLEAKFLYNDYCQKARENGMAVKLKHSDKRLITNTATTDKSSVSSMDVVIDSTEGTQSDSIHLPVSSPDFEPITSSTPTKTPTHQRANVRLPSRAAARNLTSQPSFMDPSNQDTGTIVTVTVQWKSQTSSKVLPDDLCSLGKMMCRGTYTQIARAAWKNDRVREQLTLLLLKQIDKECNLCSSKNPSILRLTSKKDILEFTTTKFGEEIKQRTPLLHSNSFGTQEKVQRI